MWYILVKCIGENGGLETTIVRMDNDTTTRCYQTFVRIGPFTSRAIAEAYIVW